MTTELQRAMARYEDSRIEYKKAVLASHGGAGGDGIRVAIREFQEANAQLRQLTGVPPRPAAHRPRMSSGPDRERHAAGGLSFFRRLLNAS